MSTVSYSYLINGDYSRHVVPHRGIRQGDPISPYLFLLVADAFSGLIHCGVNSGQLHGTKVCRRSLTISHLFFVDDSLLFLRANKRECLEIVNIIDKYERASGQKINF